MLGLNKTAADFTRPIYLEGLPVKVISDHAASRLEYSGARKRVLAFKRMTAEHRNKLQSFI